MKTNLPKKVREIIERLKMAGYLVFIVGGAVRDLIMQRPVADWDFATSAIPEEVLNLFDKGYLDNKFGTVKILDDNELFEITTFRSEKGYSDRRHPDKVIWGKTITEDLARRDFSINAIAINPKSETEAEVIDPYGGLEDIKNNIVRAVGDPNLRFSEDALRMLRAIRIASQLKFTINERTFEAIKNNATLIERISGERIRDEIFKMLSTATPADSFWVLRNSSLLSFIFPELDKCFSIEQKSIGRHHIYDVGTHCFKSLEFCPSKNSLVRFATLIHDIGKPDVVGRGSKGEITFYNHEVVGAHIARNIADRLHLSKKERDKLVILVRWHQFTVDEATTAAAVRRFIRRVGIDNINDMVDLRIGDRLGGGLKEATGWRLRRFIKMIGQELHPPFSVADLAINGNDVMKILGIGSGPTVGKFLNQLFEEVSANKKTNTRGFLLRRLGEIKSIV